MKKRPLARVGIRRSLGALAVCLNAGTAHAQTTEPPLPAAASEVAPPVTKPQVLRVWLDVGSSGVDKARVQTAIERELGTPIELSETPNTALSIVVSADRHVQVTYRSESGELLTRNVDLPTSTEREVEVIALMVGNLTRNEAAELLAALQSRPAEKPQEKPAEPPAPAVQPPKAPAKNAPKPPKKPESEGLGNGYLYSKRPGANASFFHPISVLRDSERRVLAIELSAAYGHVGAIEGVGLSLGGLTVEHQARGMALGLGFVKVKGPMQGLQCGIFYSEGLGDQLGTNLSAGVLYHQAKIMGLAISGLVTLAHDIDGLGVAGLFGMGHDLRGVHATGLVSIATGSFEGVQISGIFQSSEELRGVAVSGLVNRAKSTSGLAFSSLVNVTGDLDGGSMALVNVGGRVRGVQLGLVNVASEVEGVQLGVANFSKKNGDTQVIAFGSNLTPLNAGLKFTTGYGYSEMGVGGNLSSHEVEVFLGLGGHLPLGRLSFDLGGRISASDDTRPQTNSPRRTDVHYLGRANFRLKGALELFAGGGARHSVIGDGAGTVNPEFFGGVALF